MATRAGREGGAGQALPHIRVDRFRTSERYSPPSRDFSGASDWPDRQVHGARLGAELTFSLARAAEQAAQVTDTAGGVYLEVQSTDAARLPDLTWASQGIRLGAVRNTAGEAQVGALFVPPTAHAFLTRKVREYAEESTPHGEPKHQDKFGHVDQIRPGSLQSMWTDMRPLPAEDESIWWECWCWADRVSELVAVARRNELLVSDRRLRFPEYEVVPVFGDRAQISALVHRSGAIEELRRASDTPSFFMVTVRRDQQGWVEDLTQRLVPPPAEAPHVCLLDNGVANAHPLIAPSLRPADCFSVDQRWGVDDHDPHGHGTNMAGCALYGDLTEPLADRGQIVLRKKLESVKFLPPPGFNPTDPLAYGAITQQAIRVPETANPNRARVYCMAVTNDDVSGERPSSWSAAIDQACAGTMAADGANGQRLIIVSGGNIQDSSDPDEISDPDEFPIEDPAQAWNALAVAGYTEKVEITPEDNLQGWRAVADAGELSPYSRISTDWEHASTPIKPEIVLEAGNRAINEHGTEVVSGVPSLSLLTTDKNFLRFPLTTFWATSAATAQAAGMVAEIMAEHPTFWPETIRALLVHSADWTPAMRARIDAAPGKRAKVNLLRHFGYGVPRLDRALHSARNDLALIAQSTIKPFRRDRTTDDRGRAVLRAPTFDEAHFYTLPWPRDTLERMGETRVRLKVVLSYFVEPSPGDMAPVTPARYQSFGLRFDLKRPLDTSEVFRKRINRLDRQAGEQLPAADADGGWTFGSKHVAAGSLHVDIWTGRAADLAPRNELAIYPVGGWWKSRTAQRRYDNEARYALVMSLSTEDQEVNLYSEIEQKISVEAGDIEVQV